MDEEIRIAYLEESPQRLDKYLAAQFPQLSRARWQALIKDGFVKRNNFIILKPGEEIKYGDIIQAIIPPAKPAQLEPESLPIEILYEDDNVIVVNKPAGLVVHPAAGHASGTLVQAVLAHAPQIQGVGGEQRPGVVHRLDKDTSGIILFAKNDFAHHWLQEQFRSRRAQKYYLALVDGRPPTPLGRIEAAIGRSSHQRKQMAIVVATKGRIAQSEYRTLATFPLHTLLEVHPITGRTHQIRLHLSFIGCPVVGDTVYGRKTPSIPLKRFFLHAARLTIWLPGYGEPITFEAPLPQELRDILTLLQNSGG